MILRYLLITATLYGCCFAVDTGDLFRLHKMKKHSKFATLYYLAKDYLQHANIYNTSVEFTVPLFSFTFPTLENPNDHTSLMKQNLIGQAIFFLVIVVSFVLSIAFPVFLNDIAPQSRSFSNPHIQYYHDMLVYALHRFKARQFQGYGGLCLQHAACEAHTDSKEFGLLSLPFKLFYRDKTWFNTSQPRRNEDCNLLYHCPFSVLRLVRYLMNMSFRFLGFT